MAENSPAETRNSGPRRIERPLSPHLQIYRLPIAAVTSIINRAAGHALIAGTLLAVWWLVAAATSDTAFDRANWVATSWFGDLVFLGSAWALWYHYLAGLRHFYFDAGHGLHPKAAEKSSWAIIAGSVLLTVLTVIIL